MEFLGGFRERPPRKIEIQIDCRAGSNKFISHFDCKKDTYLDSGDICFYGNGPDNALWCIGIEHKTIKDIVDCIKTGRFTGTQLPAMMEMYDVCFLMIEGYVNYDKNGMLANKYGGDYTSFSVPYKGFNNFLVSVQMFSSLAGIPCIVLHTRNKADSIEVITSLYDYFQKKWEDHKSISAPDQTQVQRSTYHIDFVKPDPGEDGYPRYLLRQCIFQIKGFGWDTAGAAASKFGTLEVAMQATVKDWESIDRIGKKLANRAYEALHGKQGE